MFAVPVIDFFVFVCVLDEQKSVLYCYYTIEFFSLPAPYLSVTKL